MDDAANHAIYDVNTIANYDRDIIPLLDAPVGAAFAAARRSGIFSPGFGAIVVLSSPGTCICQRLVAKIERCRGSTLRIVVSQQGGLVYDEAC